MWTDSHCHLDYDRMVPDALAAAAEAGVTRLVTVGTDADHSAAGIASAREHDELFATVGLHPHDASIGLDGIRTLLDPLDPVIVGIGECGLDYYYEHSPRDVQREAFAAQIQLATALGLTLVIHTRDAWDDTFDVLDGERLPERWVLHCFSGGADEARKVLDRGGFVSFSGIVTFKNAAEVREAAALCPEDRLLVETDSPYLAPVPHRGKPNQPGWVPLVGAAVADARAVPVARIEAATWDNATVAFNLPV